MFPKSQTVVSVALIIALLLMPASVQSGYKPGSRPIVDIGEGHPSGGLNASAVAAAVPTNRDVIVVIPIAGTYWFLRLGVSFFTSWW